jgi:hypothetical protein
LVFIKNGIDTVSSRNVNQGRHREENSRENEGKGKQDAAMQKNYQRWRSFLLFGNLLLNLLLPPSLEIAGDFSAKRGIKTENARYVH